jgi:hypothetical protein
MADQVCFWFTWMEVCRAYCVQYCTNMDCLDCEQETSDILWVSTIWSVQS